MRFSPIIVFVLVMGLVGCVRASSSLAQSNADDRWTVEVTPSSTTLVIGQTFTVRTHVVWTGVGEYTGFGQPRFYLKILSPDGEEQDLENPIIKPTRPEPIHTYGQDAEFELEAVRPGSVVFHSWAYGEVWYPDCPCFSFVNSLPGESSIVTVFESDALCQTYLPLVVK